VNRKVSREEVDRPHPSLGGPRWAWPHGPARMTAREAEKAEKPGALDGEGLRGEPPAVNSNPPAVTRGS